MLCINGLSCKHSTNAIDVPRTNNTGRLLTAHRHLHVGVKDDKGRQASKTIMVFSAKIQAKYACVTIESNNHCSS